MPNRTIKDALKKATTDTKFAADLVSKPETLKTTYNLSDAQVAQLKNLGAAAKAAGPALGLGGGRGGVAATDVHYE